MSDDHASRSRPPVERELAAGAVIGAFVGAGAGVASLAVGIVVAVVAATRIELCLFGATCEPWDPTTTPLALASHGVDLALLVLAGAALVAAGCALGWWILCRHDVDARRTVRDAAALTLLLVLLVGTGTAWLALPSRALDGDALTIEALWVALAVGAVAAPTGAVIARASSALAQRRAGSLEPVEVAGLEVFE